MAEKAEHHELDKLRAQLSQLEEALNREITLRRDAERSSKAARALAMHAMESCGVQGANIVLRASPAGIELTVCAPPHENEERLARAIIEALHGALSTIGVSTMREVGVTEP